MLALRATRGQRYYSAAPLPLLQPYPGHYPAVEVSRTANIKQTTLRSTERLIRKLRDARYEDGGMVKELQTLWKKLKNYNRIVEMIS